MATQVDLLTKVRREGFEMIEEYYGRTGRAAQFGHQNHVHHHPRYQHQQLPFVYGPRISRARVPVFTSKKSTQRCDDMAEVPVITSDQAAKIYGGFVIVEHGWRKPFPRA